MTARTHIDRPISEAELTVIRVALERAPSSPKFSLLAGNLTHLRAIDRCGCGCDSVDFAAKDPAQPSQPIADGIGTTPGGGSVGLIVWGRAGAVTGLEVYDLGAGEDDLRLPTLDSIHGFQSGAA